MRSLQAAVPNGRIGSYNLKGLIAKCQTGTAESTLQSPLEFGPVILRP